MPRYIAKIRGSNFLLKFTERWERMGFFTHRLVDAPDSVLGGHTALEDFRSSEKYVGLMKMALYSDDDPPLLRVSEIREVDPDTEFEKGPPGLVFYDEEKTNADERTRKT